MYIIGVAGGSGSGKSTVVKRITGQLNSELIQVIPQDAYYHDNSKLSPSAKKNINFDHPSAIEFPLLMEHLNQLKQGNSVEMPIYDYITCARAPETITIKPVKIILVEGILIFTWKPLREALDIRIFIDADADERLARIIRRDVNQRGRNYLEVINHYSQYVKPMHNIFIEPTKRFADIIVPRGGNNHVAVEMIISQLKQLATE